MADWDGMISKSNGGYGSKSIRDEEFEEEEVWSMMKGNEDSSLNMMRKSKNSSYSSSSSALFLPGTKPRMIPRGHEGDNHDLLFQQSSAPLNIPDWSKIYGKNGKMSSLVDDGDDAVCDDGYHANGNDDHENANDDDDDEGDMVPPHELIARKLARSQISSFSVCEGVGRKLKGRDLSRVRNAILTKTGFLE